MTAVTKVRMERGPGASAWLWVLPVAVAASAAPAGAQLNVPAQPFSPPTGAYAVGTREYLWIDRDRGEPFSTHPYDKRHVLVQVWYPAAVEPRAERALYIRDLTEFGEFDGFRAVSTVRTNSVRNAPLAASAAPFPVLVYHHGGGWTRFTSTFQTEELASHGYVVFSVDHNGFNRTRLFPDGYRLEVDTLQLPTPTGNMRDNARRIWQFLGDHHFPQWVADGRFALDQIEALNRGGEPFAGRLDLDRIGMLGWSFGGATSIQSSYEDPRVKAAIDVDGQLFGDVVRAGTSRPVMLMHSDPPSVSPDSVEQAAIMRELMADVNRQDSTFLSNARHDWYDLRIRGATHGSFSDLVIFFPPGPDQIEVRRGHQIINAYAVAFFDKYLKGKSSPLLDKRKSPYPEVEIRKK